jgi:hypothetical protein
MIWNMKNTQNDICNKITTIRDNVMMETQLLLVVE